MGTVTLAWQPPQTDGGSPLLGYRIYRGIQSGKEHPHEFIAASMKTSFIDTNLPVDTYYYYVTAINAVGEGPQSGEVEAIVTSEPEHPYEE